MLHAMTSIHGKANRVSKNTCNVITEIRGINGKGPLSANRCSETYIFRIMRNEIHRIRMDVLSIEIELEPVIRINRAEYGHRLIFAVLHFRATDQIHDIRGVEAIRTSDCHRS